jgi:hypothetical protein
MVDLNEGPGFIPDDSLEIPTLVIEHKIYI